MVKVWFEPKQNITFEIRMEQQKEWFKEWFNSPYYHILYGDRDKKEAEYFLTNLIERFEPKLEASFLDLACGAGRHSIFLNNLGFNVTGIDLSAHSISLAKHFENPKLHFNVGDLRTFTLDESFDFQFTKCDFKNSDNYAIKSTGVCSRVNISGCLFLDIKNGVRFYRDEYIWITNNFFYFTGSSSTGVEFDSVDDSFIINNILNVIFFYYNFIYINFFFNF
jgi:SAM-dependent methyltransferase